MTVVQKVPKLFWRLIKVPARTAYALGLGPLAGRVALLLTTTGRVSGLPRTTPLQYEEAGGLLYVGAARGPAADWLKNAAANPRVEVRVGRRRFKGLAEPVTQAARVADFLELRLSRRPRMMRALLRAEGIAGQPTRADLERVAARLAVLIIRPDEG